MDKDLNIVECEFVSYFVSLELFVQFWVSLDKLNMGLTSCNSGLHCTMSNLLINAFEHSIVRGHHPELFFYFA